MILFGGKCQHTWHELALIEDLMNISSPRRIVEIGTGCGNLTLYLATWAKANNSMVLSIDITHKRLSLAVKEALKSFGVQLLIADCFQLQIVNSISEFIDNKNLIYCDGGDKTKELMTFVNLLKSGDVIACHDWDTEVKPDDFSKIWCEKYQLKPFWNYERRQTRNMAWIKQ